MSTLKLKFLIWKISFKNALHRLATKRTQQFLSVGNLYAKLQQRKLLLLLLLLLLLQKVVQQQLKELQLKELLDRQLKELQELFLFLILQYLQLCLYRTIQTGPILFTTTQSVVKS